MKNDKPYIKDLTIKKEDVVKTVDYINALDFLIANGFTQADFEQLKDLGIAVENVYQQINFFKKNNSQCTLLSPASINDGIVKLSFDSHLRYANLYNSLKDQLKVSKFVPASGAATRMFKFLCEFLNNFNPEQYTINEYINRKSDHELQVFIVGIDKLPFFSEIYSRLILEIENFKSLPKEQRIYLFIKYVLDDNKFDFSSKPKAVLPFHIHSEYIATPIHEQICEGLEYAKTNNSVDIHFTISKEHEEIFNAVLEKAYSDLKIDKKIKLNVTYSFQNSSTNTIAVDENNYPIRCADNKFMFRPGGHGALLYNLNELEHDIVFVKNIDNVSMNFAEENTTYKKSLAGILLEKQQRIFEILNQISQKNFIALDVSEILKFAKNSLMLSVDFSIESSTQSQQFEYIYNLLNKPIRICGMVKNEGEPGGGPFWIIDKYGSKKLQIVESSQIDLSNNHQKEIFNQSTHFNSVDLVCGLKNFRGDKFDLNKYVDHDKGFVVEKSNNGVKYKAYELPGLWNGAMSDWITIFVEVPLSTFNPVKTVNDLLKSGHQSQNNLSNN